MQTLKYGYSVEFDGVGEDPGGRRDLGHCSQLAVFHRLNEHCGQPDDQQQNFTYELVSDYRGGTGVILLMAHIHRVCAIP